MKCKLIGILAATTVLMMGCHKAESPATVQRDVAKAQDEAANKEAKANQQAADTVGSANENLEKADAKTADATYAVAIAKADGDHKIGVAKCEGLAGDAQKACVDQADAMRDLAKAKAEAARASHT
jgi:hypothetical protein